MGGTDRDGSRAVRLRDLWHGRRAGVQRPLLPRRVSCRRIHRLVQHVCGGLRRAAGGWSDLLPLRRSARTQMGTGGNAVPDGHLHLRDRPPAHLRPGGAAGADPARGAAHPPGPRGGCRAGGRHRPSRRDRGEGQTGPPLVTGIRRCRRRHGSWGSDLDSGPVVARRGRDELGLANRVLLICAS